MATQKQVDYVKLLQKKFDPFNIEEKYTDEQIKKMSHKEVSQVIEHLKEEIAKDELYNECMSAGLPNQ
ncbi:hypothetical protein NSA29_12090 [Staphylococcus warneri]|uniref:hypothetical protein n=1 Tax=Staphylococcus warneri TaxID=1292 RepID=UPI00214CC3B2|nr:hypothetical protein [Staphylococcus warneri]MCR1798275.1 hypothetical protein [Staphylococcus warneri]